jgi:hypothetical protein
VAQGPLVHVRQGGGRRMSEHCPTTSTSKALVCTGEIIPPSMPREPVDMNTPALDLLRIPQTAPTAAAGVLTDGKISQQASTSSIGGSIDGRQRRSPPRVKLQRVHADLAKAYPPDGNGKTWWARLKSALGTTSSAFVDASLHQLQAAARVPGGGISELAVNAALAMIGAAQPKDEIEAALAIQMACTHTAAMAVLARLGCGHGTERRVAALGSAASRLLRAYAMQVETLRRLRRGGDQHIRVEHVHVHAGGQAIVGAVSPP